MPQGKYNCDGQYNFAEQNTTPVSRDAEGVVPYVCKTTCRHFKINHLAFPLWGEWRQSRRERSYSLAIVYVNDLYRLDFHFIPSSHSPHGACPFCRFATFSPFHRGNLPQRGKQRRLVFVIAVFAVADFSVVVVVKLVRGYRFVFRSALARRAK